MTTDVLTPPTTFAAAYERLDAIAPLADLRQRGYDAFVQRGFPTLRDEAWRYTNVKPIVDGAFDHASEAPAAVALDDLAPYLFDDERTCRFVLVNGAARDELSRAGDLPDGVRVESLAACVAAGDADVLARLGSAIDGAANLADAPFAAMNTALIEDGVVIRLPKNTVVDAPIHVMHVVARDAGAVAVHPRTLIIAENGSKATIVEQYIGLGDGGGFTNAVVEIAADANVNVKHTRVIRERDDANHISMVAVHESGPSQVISNVVTLTGRLVRHNINAAMDAAQSDVTFNGLTLGRDDQHVDHALNIEHRQPHCTSWQFFKNVMNDRSRGVFSGRIYVAEDAQKTDAKQTNMNLLLSPDASVDTKPQLEIFADDVKCTHGATIGQLEPSQLFYLRARGISHRDAYAMLVYAFAAEVLDEIDVEPLRDQLVAALMERLPSAPR